MRNQFLPLVVKHFPGLARIAHLLYADHSVLRYNHERASFGSEEGAAQGCLLGVFLFALSLTENVVKPISLEVPELEVHGWYADDGSLAGHTDDVFRACNVVLRTGPSIEYNLNMSKSEVFFPIWLSGGTPTSDPFDPRMKRAKEGVVTLGTPIGTDNFVKRYLANKVSGVQKLLEMIEKLDNPQCEWIMLRNSAFGKFGSRLRTVPTALALPAANAVDKIVADTFSRVVGAPNFNSTQKGFLHLSLGVRSAASHASAARLASMTSVHKEITNIGLPAIALPRDMDATVQHFKTQISAGFIFNQEVAHKQKALSTLVDSELKIRLMATLNTREKATLLAFTAPHASAFLRQLPTSSQWKMPNELMITLLRLRLALPIAAAPRPCPVPKCNKICDEYGVHAMSCMRSHDMIGKHNLICDFLASKFRQVGYRTDNNVPNLTLGPHTKERPADFLVIRHSRDENHEFTNIAFDVTVANPLKRSAVNQTSAGKTLFAADALFDKKLAKYNTLAPGTKVIPLAFQALGGHRAEVSNEILALAQRLRFQRRIPVCAIQAELTAQLSFILMKGVAAQILKRCTPFNLVPEEAGVM